MNLKNIVTSVLVLGSIGLISACSEENGWTIVEHKGSPFGEERTVGSGVKYVRANLLPEKGPVAEPIMEEVEALLEQYMETAHISKPKATMPSAEPIFNESQGKGKK